MFIELTDRSTDIDNKVMININTIELVNNYSKYAKVHFTDGSTLELKETYDQVKQLIKEQLGK